MRDRRGLTLIEVLAATVLIAMIAAVCVPVMRSASAALEPQDREIEVAELSLLIDQWLAEEAPPAFSREDVFEGQILWPDHPTRPPVDVRLLLSRDSALHHGWLLLQCESFDLLRWVPLAPPDQEEGGGMP
jgi:prepilin-type N-terminal cleavage/methylation domain-containing protein